MRAKINRNKKNRNVTARKHAKLRAHRRRRKTLTSHAKRCLND